MTQQNLPLVVPQGTEAIPQVVGWSFYAVRPSGIEILIHPTTTGSLAYSDTSDIRTTLNGLIFLPDQMAAFDPTRDALKVKMIRGSATSDMGLFYATSLVRQKNAVLDTSLDEVTPTPKDLIHIDFADGTVRLGQSSENVLIIARGGDPSQFIMDLAKASGFSFSVANSIGIMENSKTWDPFTPYISIINELVPFAGHRPPWVDHAGVFRSIAANVIESTVIPLENLGPVAETITVSEVFLSSPNRVVVWDSETPLKGVWTAPASSPHSFSKRGYYVTQSNQQQGLQSVSQAEDAARALGEQLTARTLDCQIMPTPVIDGPTILSYDGALWLIRGWSLDTAPGSLMTINATELILDDAGTTSS